MVPNWGTPHHRQQRHAVPRLPHHQHRLHIRRPGPRRAGDRPLCQRALRHRAVARLGRGDRLSRRLHHVRAGRRRHHLPRHGQRRVSQSRGSRTCSPGSRKRTCRQRLRGHRRVFADAGSGSAEVGAGGYCDSDTAGVWAVDRRGGGGGCVGIGDESGGYRMGWRVGGGCGVD